MEQLIFSTNNQHKLSEVKAILEKDYKILGLSEIGIDTDIPETGDTLEENALIKARYLWEEKGINCFADDTGLEVEALDNAPGVYSARYAGEQKSSADNVHKLLQELADKPNRKARFRTVIAAILDGKEYLFEGIVSGSIATKPKGASGFGYDPVFVPDGYTETFAELGDHVKNTISHRARAVSNFCNYLNNKQS